MSDAVHAREHHAVMIGGPDGLREAEFDYLEHLRARSIPFFEERRQSGKWWCRFGGYVGAVALPGGRTLEILPKLDGAEPHEERAVAMRMLAATCLLPSVDDEIGRYARSPHLLEAYLAMAAELGQATLRQGLVHRYERRQLGSTAVRGRLRLPAQLARYPARYDTLLVEADLFTPDTPINRVIKAGIARIARLARVPTTLACCRELLIRLDGVGNLPRADGHVVKALHIDRRHAGLRPLLDALRLILHDLGSAAAAGPDAPGPAWLFAMDRLWEAFVARRLRRLVPALEVTEQGPVRPLTTSGEFPMRPDIVVAVHGEARTVLDTKWKQIDQPGDVDVADLRQAYAYARIYGTRRVVLLYPTWAAKPARRDLVVADRDGEITISIQQLPLATGAADVFDRVLVALAQGAATQLP